MKLSERAACRAVNLLGAVISLLVVAPLMLMIAIAVKLSSPGPVFFTQPRVGLDRRGLIKGKEDALDKIDTRNFISARLLRNRN